MIIEFEFLLDRGVYLLVDYTWSPVAILTMNKFWIPHRDARSDEFWKWWVDEFKSDEQICSSFAHDVRSVVEVMSFLTHQLIKSK